MRQGDIKLYDQLADRLNEFDQIENLLGIRSKQNFHCFLLQIIDSIRRIKYVDVLKEKGCGAIHADATAGCFDPIKAAIWHNEQGEVQEALWLIFLSTHFGKNKNTGWNLCKAFYGAFEHSSYWTWMRISANPKSFRKWLSINQNKLIAMGKFGNHRKYQSIDANKPSGTGLAICSYIEWIENFHGYENILGELSHKNINTPYTSFRALYDSLDSVVSFGRTAKFDFLTMIGKVGLLDIAPDSTYMSGATGPRIGAQLLFTGNKSGKLSGKDLEQRLETLNEHLAIYFGMQVLEDSLCNWQKSPSLYIHFKG